MRAALVLLTLLSCGASRAVEIELVTIGPGSEFWSVFGHNALLVREPGGRALVYNFGVFDPEEPGFLGRFLRGEPIYRLEAWTPAELSLYRREGRRIESQRLLLPAEAAAGLAARLAENARPENADYRYHYFRDNCSTRVRDALDQALGGLLRRDGSSRSRGLSYRFHALRMSASHPWLWAAIDLGLGQPADRPLSLWEESFLPELLARHLEQLRESGALAAEAPRVLAPGTLPSAPASPPDPLLPFAAVGPILAIALFLALRRPGPSRLRRAGVLFLGGFWLLAGLAGLALAWLWLFSAHDFSTRNENLLLLHPLTLLLLPALPALWADKRASAMTRGLALLVAALAVLAFLLKGLPMFNQPNLHWIALLSPIHVAAALALTLRSRALA